MIRLKCLFLILLILATGCSQDTNTLVPEPIPVVESPADLTLTVENVVQAVETENVVTPEVLPHPEPSLSSVEKFGIVVNGFISYLLLNKEKITSDEAVYLLFVEYTEAHLQIGDDMYKVRDWLDSIPKENWPLIYEVGLALENDDNNGGSAEVLTSVMIILRGNCKVNCRAVFSALWWATAHFASGTHWFYIPDSIDSNHPQPVLCGKTFNYEYLLDILDQRCPMYKVDYLPTGVRVSEVKQRGMNLEWSLDPNAVPVIVTVSAVAIVVGVIVLAPGAAPALVPVLLVVP